MSLPLANHAPNGPGRPGVNSVAGRDAVCRPLRPKSACARPGGFTLVELLVTVALIATLATLVMFAMHGVMEHARTVRTRAQIAKLDAIISGQYQQYHLRRVPIFIPAGMSPASATKLRLNALRELMRMELPDRMSDVIDVPVTTGMARPAVSRAYVRAIANAATRSGQTWSKTFQGAECLFLIISVSSDGTRNALEFFRESEFGDFDADGMREILDGWGKPIEFLRWAPGLRSIIQDGDADHPDPFDPRRIYNNNFSLYPYIYSPGPDGEYDTVSDASTAMRYSTIMPPNNPYTVPSSGSLIGTQEDTNGDGTNNFVDNIHNHLVETGVTR